MNRQQLLLKLDRAWVVLGDSFAGLTEAQMTEPGVTGEWSVKDILGHVTAWEVELLEHLPGIMAGRRPPKYSDRYGGIDAFNALKARETRARSLDEVLATFHSTHDQVLALVGDVPEELLLTETRARRRIRLDTYSHYPIHTRAILEWRVSQGF